MAFDYDLFIIGAGSGGVRAARIAAGYGARVGIAEESRVGGTCVIRGCVPKKLLVYASHFGEDFEDADGYGWSVPKPSFDWARLIANKDKEIDRLNQAYKSTLAKAGVELIESRAELVDQHTISIGGKQVRAEVILIATGSWPELPKLPGIEHAISSNECFHLETLPERVVVVGGGYIALEFAGIFNGLGSKTTVLYRGEQVLRGFDGDVRNFLQDELVKKGIDVRCHTNVTRIDKVAGGLAVTLDDGTAIHCDQVLYATGRRPLTRNMGLERIGVALDDVGAIKVDGWSKSSMPNIYAVGDCTNRVNLTPVAIREGHAFADSVFGNKPWMIDHSDFPSAVFTQPPVATVGETEERARAKYGAVDIYRETFRPMKHTMTGRPERTLMKLVVDRKSQAVVGAHMVGQDAPEIIQTLAIAVKLKATKQQIDQTIAIHPTAAEEFVTMRTPVAAE
uniref:glutathione-disulfide reductase n=1 Tax=Dongia deserti TaxID=2268030 RepID=UPI0038993762